MMVLLGVMSFMPSLLFAQNNDDSELLSRVFSYQRNFGHHIEGFQSNVYLKYSFFTDKRNWGLFLIPHMYSIAEGERAFVGESYCRMVFRDFNDYDIKRQVSVGNIAHYGKALPTLMELLTPSLYNECLYDRYILSPFHEANGRYYRYQCMLIGNGTALIKFSPKLKNTQLVSGEAYVNYETGHISTVVLNGEYDMIDFKITMEQGETGVRSLMPKKCEVQARFDFLGNHIRSNFNVQFDCPTTLPDSLDAERDMALMDSLRPMPLEESERNVYDLYCRPQEPDTVKKPEEPRKYNFWKDFMWDEVGDRLFTTQRAENKKASFNISPLLNPQYISYSRRRGISYKIKMGMQYNFSEHRYLTLKPQIGYNFKFKQFYYTAPLRMNYNPKRQGYAEIVFANGNRISNSSVQEYIQQRDDADYSGQDLDLFTDNIVEIKNNVEAFDWLMLTTSLTWHYRKAANRETMKKLGLPEAYTSFAPNLKVTLTPWRNGPLIMLDYERGIKGVWGSNIGYERWETDAVWKVPMRSLSLLNLRVGGGLYTNKSSNYFVDFENFREDNVPGGWDDDWSGDFQLLNSQWYNMSHYYVRANVSFESPLLFATWLPLVGRFIESERIYVGSVTLNHTRPYFEVGYGLTNRYFSGGLFCSFLNTKFQEFGAKITLELFRRW